MCRSILLLVVAAVVHEQAFQRGEAVLRAAENSAENRAKVRKQSGIEKRMLWTTSRIHGTPDPPSPYRTEVAFPNLKFTEPLEMTVVPGTDRLAVAERGGKIFTFLNNRDTTDKRLLLDAGRIVYGLAFHPQFLQNGELFVTSVLDAENPSPDGSRLSRFRVTNGNTLRADPASEEVLLTWISGGHNGGCLRFGPDGSLYLATGDGSGIADEFETGQDLSDLLGSILRIDVDRRVDNLQYAIPKDNPFVDRPGARPEIWSFGHRQVWKFSFDTASGTLWGGEVGQDLWEMIYVIVKGGNYGWGVNEGLHPFRPQRKRVDIPFVPPIVEHPHSDFRSITGGYVYHGSRLPELKQDYIYGDYDTGKVWALRYDEETLSRHRELCDTQLRLVAFGQDTAGEIYLVDYVGGQIHQLSPAAPQSEADVDFPAMLSETGLFVSTADHEPAEGVIPYSVNAPLWSDNASKDRFLALPGDSQIEFETVTYPQPAPGSKPAWRFPDGTVLVKTFSLEMEAGNPHSRRRLETRILHHERLAGIENEYGAQVWHGYTYVWNDEQTDAKLLDAKGLDRQYVVRDPQAPGGTRTQTWHFPSRSECTLCHTMAARYVLGVTTLQINKDHDYDGVIANQLATFDHLGLFTESLPASPDELPSLVDYRRTDHSVDRRARAYLHANCSHCHRKWGGGNADFQLLATLPAEETGTLNVRTLQGSFDLDDPRYVVPGDPERSMVLHRMTLAGLGRMPHVASNVVDEPAVRLIRKWIEQLPEPTTEQ